MSRPMNWSCGRMGYSVDWYHDSLGGIIGAVALLRSKLLQAAGFSHAFPERGATDAELAQELGLPPGSPSGIVQARQVHGGDVVEISEAGEAGDAPGREADALVGRASAGGALVVVGVRVADCVPILVADEARGDVAAIHAGWRGVVCGVVRAGVERLGPARQLVAAIGPSIGPCCFEVGRDVAEQIAQASHGAPVIARVAGEKAYVDLRAAVRAQLAALGLEEGRIEDVPGCTKHEPARFHSFRRDGARSGRLLSAIVASPQ
jgi:polyphenol oxidase